MAVPQTKYEHFGPLRPAVSRSRRFSVPVTRGNQRVVGAHFSIPTVVYADSSWEGEEDAVDRIFEERQAINEQLAFFVGVVHSSRLLPNARFESVFTSIQQRRNHAVSGHPEVNTQLLYKPTSMDLWFADDILQAARRSSSGTLDEAKWFGAYEDYLSAKRDLYIKYSKQ